VLVSFQQWQVLHVAAYDLCKGSIALRLAHTIPVPHLVMQFFRAPLLLLALLLLLLLLLFCGSGRHIKEQV
jgi:hypothetical protein